MSISLVVTMKTEIQPQIIHIYLLWLRAKYFMRIDWNLDCLQCAHVANALMNISNLTTSHTLPSQEKNKIPLVCMLTNTIYGILEISNNNRSHEFNLS